MKKLLLLALLLTAATALAAQPLKGKQFYVETGGPGMIFSANFDGRFERGQTLGFGYRIGLGYLLKYDESSYYDSSNGGMYVEEDKLRSYASIPLGINYVFGKKNSDHAFEAGAGVTILPKKTTAYAYGEDKPGNVMGFFTFMYRRQPVDGGFTWRVGFTPIIGTGGDLVPSAAIGIGYSF